MKRITLAHGSGGTEMNDLIQSFDFSRKKWMGCDDDSSYIKINGKNYLFTTDSFVVDPIFFPNSDIGHLAMCGTINDLVVMGADVLGISLALVLEEGFPIRDLNKIMKSIETIAKQTGVPIATGDTKVMEKGKIDKIIINTSGIGITDNVLDKPPQPGDSIIISGGVGEHGVALLSKRFDYKTDIVSDSKPLVEEMRAIKGNIRCARDVTRGGLAAVLNEYSIKYKVGMIIDETKIPINKQVVVVTNMLGIDPYALASEGRLICITNKPDVVVSTLKAHNKEAAIIGKITKGRDVIIQTKLGRRILPVPHGRIVARIC